MPAKKRPRRKRFVATMRDGTTNDVLAYSLDSARKTCHRYGMFPIDLRLKTNETVRKMTGGGWRLNTAGLEATKRDLGLTLPVVIKQTGRVGAQRGGYTLKMDGFGRLFHNITIKNYETAEQAHASLRHELRHAWQAEQVISDLDGGTAAKHAEWYRYCEKQKSWTYKTRPIEIDANRFAAQPTKISLAFPNRS